MPALAVGSTARRPEDDLHLSLAVVAALSLGGAHTPRHCPACQCIGELTALHRPQEPRDAAVNARVRTGYVPDPARKERFVLRAVGGAPVSVKAENLHVDTYDTQVLTPVAPLAQDTDYELVLLRGETTVPYFTLRTSEGADTTAPTWSGPLEATFHPSDPCSADCQVRRGARVELTAPVPQDERSGADLVAVWLTAGGPIDYTKPASGYLVAAVEDEGDDLGAGLLGGPAPAPHVELLLGGDGPCKGGSIPLPAGAKRLRVGMKVLDRAGNASAPREVEVQLSAAAKRSRR